MLSNPLRAHLKSIVERISSGKAVNFNERILVSTHAKTDQEISELLRKAIKQQRSKDIEQLDGIDQLLFDLNLGISDQDEAYNPRTQDLGDWFSGAPPWIARS